jgi:hypothetical protein
MIGILAARRLTLVMRNLLVSILFSAALAGTSTLSAAQIAGEGGNSLGFDMAPETNQWVVETAVKAISDPDGSRPRQAHVVIAAGELHDPKLV